MSIALSSKLGRATAQVYSMRFTPPYTAVPDCMDTYFKLLKEEESASVRAILNHFMFVYIHPYSDGNDRIARFLMNCMLASGGFEWCVVPMKQRTRYMEALETASCNNSTAHLPNAHISASSMPEYAPAISPQCSSSCHWRLNVKRECGVDRESCPIPAEPRPIFLLNHMLLLGFCRFF